MAGVHCLIDCGKDFTELEPNSCPTANSDKKDVWSLFCCNLSCFVVNIGTVVY